MFGRMICMLRDEIKQYTTDKKILLMQDFSNMDAAEKEENAEYMDAYASVVETIHNAFRVARWARMYKGVRLDLDDLYDLQREFNDLKK